MEDDFSMGRGGGVVQVVTRAMGSGRGSFARPPLTSCCAARFLTGLGLLPVHGPGVGNPCSRDSSGLGQPVFCIHVLRGCDGRRHHRGGESILPATGPYKGVTAVGCGTGKPKDFYSCPRTGGERARGPALGFYRYRS